jgi:hypothetical protein
MATIPVVVETGGPNLRAVASERHFLVKLVSAADRVNDGGQRGRFDFACPSQRA